MGYTDKVKKWFIDEEYEDSEFEDESEEVEVDTEPRTSIFEKAKFSKSTEAVKALNASKDSNLVLFEPRAYGETTEIAGYLVQGRAAVVNLHRLQVDQSKRVVDFLGGVIFAIDGDIQRIGPKIFLCTPKSIGVSGKIDLDENEVDE